MLDLFLCHSRVDRDKAHTVAERLERSAEATVWLEECGAGARETIATAWEGGVGSAAIILMLSPDAVPERTNRDAWKALLDHVENNTSPPVAAVLTTDCAFPRLLERTHFYRWSDQAQQLLRAVERWVLSLRTATERSRFSPAPLRWFEDRETELENLWTTLVDDASTVALVNERPGSGKTSLAQQFARAAAAHFRDAIRIDCTGRTVISVASETAAHLGITLQDSLEHALERVDTVAREHRLLLVFDNVTGPLPLRDRRGGRASVLITTREQAVVPPDHAVLMRIESIAVPAPEPPRDSDDLRLWHAMHACRIHDFSLALAARIGGASMAAAIESCERLVRGRCVDPCDCARGTFRLSAQAIAAADLDAGELYTLRRQHAEEIAAVFAAWTRNPGLCSEFLPEAESAFAWASLADWHLATRIARTAATYLKAGGQSFAAAEWYRELLAAAKTAGDDQAADDCLWELSWLETGTGEIRRPVSAGAQLSFGF
ncbi:MAG TPA: TIR domain-containing protein [Bryobacteraceae bacterium]|nr:TIR domain-containing protein [Bryobacteraceae bacterium]